MKIVCCSSGCRKNRLRGFTLAEVLIASGVVLITSVSLLAGLSFSFLTTEVERENQRATQIMLERMEGVRLFTWNELQNSSLNPTTFTNYFSPASTNTGIAYFGTVTVTPGASMYPAASYSSNVAQVTIQVQWASGNLTHTRNMSTYVSKNGIQNYVYAN